MYYQPWAENAAETEYSNAVINMWQTNDGFESTVPLNPALEWKMTFRTLVLKRVGSRRCTFGLDAEQTTLCFRADG